MEKVIWQDDDLAAYNTEDVETIMLSTEFGFNRPQYIFKNCERLFIDAEKIKSVADAIYAELGLGWLPYPENKPEKSGLYSVTISPNSCVPLPRVVRRDFYNCDTDKWRDFESADIVAFIKDVQPYSKRKQRQP